jgi:integrase
MSNLQANDLQVYWQGRSIKGLSEKVVMINRRNHQYAENFLEFQKEVKQNTRGTLDLYSFHLRTLLIWLDATPLTQSHVIKPAFPVHLDNSSNTEQTNAKICQTARAFFSWLKSEYPLQFSTIKQSWILGLKPIAKPATIKEVKYYSLDEMKQLAAVKAETLIMKRAQAAAAFLYLSGMRARAFLTLPISCVDIERRTVQQLPESGVYTKNNMAAITSLFGVPELIEIVSKWHELISKHCPPNSTWYPRLNNIGEFYPDENTVSDRNKSYYATVSRYNGLLSSLRDLCAAAGVEYKSPHAFRHGHVHLGLSNSKTLAEMKSVSLNVMHQSLTITDTIYSRMNAKELNRTISNIGTADPKENLSKDEMIRLLLKYLKDYK